MTTILSKETFCIDETTLVENRDDFETFEEELSDKRTEISCGIVCDTPNSCRVSSICHSMDDFENVSNGQMKSNSAGDEEVEEHKRNSAVNIFNETVIQEANARINHVSVLSGTIYEAYEEAPDEMHVDGFDNQVFGKNLSKLFDDHEKMDHIMKGSHSNAYVSNISNTNSSMNRPPLAPARIGSNAPSTSDKVMISKSDALTVLEEKSLLVFLRIRPPTYVNEIGSTEGSISTIEILDNKIDSLPTTIRTYPPLSSNAAKVTRTERHHVVPDSILKATLASKSLTDDGSADCGLDSNIEVRGVKEYTFSGVFGPDSTQSEIYENVAAPLVEGLFPKETSGGTFGESALLFTLGFTNAGKTYTVMGSNFEEDRSGDKKKHIAENLSPHEDWGIIPRSIHHILSRIDGYNDSSSPSPKLHFYMSYLEIYNEQIFDLLPNKTSGATTKRPIYGTAALKLRESRHGRIFVRGLARHHISSIQQGLELAHQAKNNRHTSSNNINMSSSRSHSICQLEISHFNSAIENNGSQSDSDTASEMDADDDNSVCSKSSSGSTKTRSNSTIIWIVDLAGSERNKKTGVIRNTRNQKEAALINASLMNLMRCLREMLYHQPKKNGATKCCVVPFRESKLTHMFMNHLTGPSASRTSIIVNVNPAAHDFDETQHVLSYATTARNIKISAVDYNQKRQLLAKEYKEKISPIKKLAKIVQKLSPKKRKGLSDSKSEVKRIRCNYNLKKKDITTTQVDSILKHSSVSSQSAENVQLEQLREENFSFKITVDDLKQQLIECEADVRQEVVDMMNEQLQESKNWYEKRISTLEEQIISLQSSNTKQALLKAQKHIDDLLDRINECEDEMKRICEEHQKEIDEKSATLLKITNVQALEMENITQTHRDEIGKECEKNMMLEMQNGALRHQIQELHVNHQLLLTKYNDLLSLAGKKESDTADSTQTVNSDCGASFGGPKSPVFKKLPRERCSDVASATSCVDIVLSPKNKRSGWGFMRSPAKIVGENSSGITKSRSPLGKITNN